MAKSPKRRASAIPAGVPAGALFINRTDLTNTQVKEACRYTVSSVLRMTYFLFGIALGVFAIVWRVAFDADTLATVLVLLVGLMTVWQGSRLPMESARRMISQLDKAGQDSRKRTYFATETEFGVVLADGQARTFPWSAFGRAVVTQKVACLTLTGQSVLLVVAMDGFTKGEPAEFVRFLAEHVNEAPRNAVTRLCEKACRTLDDWGSVQAAQREKDAAKKAAKAERRARRKNKGKDRS